MANLSTTPKTCRKCGEEKGRSEFHKQSSSADGLRGACKACRKIYGAEYQLKNRTRIREYRREYYRKHSKTPGFRATQRIHAKKYYYSHPLETKARSMVANAIQAGTLIKPLLCSKCSRTANVQGHHEDYNKPLDVEWLCRKCHDQVANH